MDEDLAEELLNNGFTITEILEECGMEEREALDILLPHLLNRGTLPAWIEQMVERNSNLTQKDD